MIQPSTIPTLRRGLSADPLIDTLQRRFKTVPAPRQQASCTCPMADVLMSVFAMFATKEPSMLSFQDHHRELNIEKPFKISAMPSDTQMREILDAIDGSGYFCSDNLSCPHCLVRRKNNTEQYYHQVVAAVLVHPATKQVIPLAV